MQGFFRSVRVNESHFLSSMRWQPISGIKCLGGWVCIPLPFSILEVFEVVLGFLEGGKKSRLSLVLI